MSFSTRIIFKTAVTLQLQKLLKLIPASPNGVTILCFHRISSQYDYFWQPIYPETFRLMLESLVKEYQIIPISQIENLAGKSTKPPLVLSFDDGYKDFIDEAMPLLQYYEVPSNHNIVIDCADGKSYIWTQKLNHLFNLLRNSSRFSINVALDKSFVLDITQPCKNWFVLYYKTLFYLFKLEARERAECITTLERYLNINPNDYPISMMNWDDIKFLAKNNVEIGSHTTSHVSLSSVKNEADFAHELDYSKKRIEETLKCECPVIALPNGLSNEIVNQRASDAGYKAVLCLAGSGSSAGKSTDKIKFYNRLNMIQEPVNYMNVRIKLYEKGFTK